MADVIQVLNAGSSSIKFSAFGAHGDEPDLLLRGSMEGIYTSPAFRAANASGAEVETKHWGDGTELGHGGAIAFLAELLRGHGEGHHLVAVGHRVVHGGVQFTRSVKATPEVVAALDALSPLAPLHQPHNLKPIRILAQRRPELPQIVCFDTAFHRGQPDAAQAFALPASITQRGVRRYGFHGLSYEYIASVLPAVDATAAAGRTVVAHLGNGSSMCALVAGRSVASTMGFTAVDGLPMGTRCGNLDPGVILYMMDELGMAPIAKALAAPIFMPLDVSREGGSRPCLLKSRRREASWISSAFDSRGAEGHLHGGLQNCSAEGFGKALDISCHSFIRMARLAVPLMPDGGTMSTMSYYGANRVVPNYNIMGPVKAALEAVSRYLAYELGSEGIRVHAISPGTAQDPRRLRTEGLRPDAQRSSAARAPWRTGRHPECRVYPRASRDALCAADVGRNAVWGWRHHGVARPGSN